MIKFNLKNKNESNIYDSNKNPFAEIGAKLSLAKGKEFDMIIKDLIIKIKPGRKINFGSFNMNKCFVFKFKDSLERMSIESEIEITHNNDLSNFIFFKNEWL